MYFLSLAALAHLQTKSTIYVFQLFQSIVRPLETLLRESRSVNSNSGNGRGFFLSSLKHPSLVKLTAQPEFYGQEKSVQCMCKIIRL